MKILSWNCNGKFREKYPQIIEQESDTYINADIYIICECENPDEDNPQYTQYKKLVEQEVGNNYYWVGDYHYKGLAVFAKNNITLEKIETNGEFKNFIALRVNDSFNLLAVWARYKDEENDLNPYVEMMHDFYDANTELFDENLIICGDFNSSVKFNDKHKTKDSNGMAKDHTNLNKKLNKKGLYSIYHEVTGEENGEETHNTFFQSRHLNLPFHLDYIYANKKLIEKTTFIKCGDKTQREVSNRFEIPDHWKWISLSDHLPITLEFE